MKSDVKNENEQKKQPRTECLNLTTCLL
jgi:hypothetical protein